MSQDPKVQANIAGLVLAFKSLESPKNLIRVAQDFPETPPGQPPMNQSPMKPKKRSNSKKKK